MSYSRLLAMLVGLGMLGACDDVDDRKRAAQNDNGTDVSLSLGEGNGGISADGNSGKVSVDLPGVKGSFTIPGIKLGGEKIDIDGVKLYPGSRVTGVDVAGEEGHSEGSVTMRFESDASPATIQRYYLDAFRDRGLTAAAQGSGVAGKDHEGKSFTITLDPKGSGTRGELQLGG